jgi:hypothetical protein
MLSQTEAKKVCNILLVSVLHIVGGGKSARFRFQFSKDNLTCDNMPVAFASGGFLYANLN